MDGIRATDENELEKYHHSPGQNYEIIKDFRNPGKWR